MVVMIIMMVIKEETVIGGKREGMSERNVKREKFYKTIFLRYDNDDNTMKKEHVEHLRRWREKRTNRGGKQ